MLVIIQFPITDIRLFLEEITGKLRRPNWFTSVPDEDFIRSFGHIRFRRLGGLSGWVGESIICEANKAIRFDNLATFSDEHTGKKYQLKIIFRRFYSDGVAVGKLEIGIRLKVEKKENLSIDSLNNFLTYILNLPVIVPLRRGKQRCKLSEIPSVLGELYLENTTEINNLNNVKKSWAKVSKPLIVVLHNEKEVQSERFWGRQINMNYSTKSSLRYYLFDNNGKSYSTWVVEEGMLDLTIRPLRIYLLRLYAEQECLKRVLENLANEDIKIKPRSIPSRELQAYLNSSISRIIKLETKTDLISNNIIANLARNTMDLIVPGEKDEILRALERIDIRLNIFHKTEKFIEQISYKEYYEHLESSQAHKIQDENLRSNIIRSLKNITYNNVDLGLFDLGKILENELKLLLEQYKSLSLFEISRKELSNLNEMISCIERIGIQINKNDIHFLRQERNKRAHGHIPSLDERKELMFHAPFIVDLYIKYIALFNLERTLLIKDNLDKQH